MDGGIVVGYLVTFLLGGAARLADRQLDGLLSTLYDRVRNRLRGAQALNDLANDPADPGGQRRVRQLLEDAAARDRGFADQIARLQRDLDGRGARNLFVNAPGADIVIGINHGVAVHNGNVYVTNNPGPPDISTAPGWVKFVAVLGMALCVAGLGLFGYTLFTDQPELGSPDFGTTPSGIPLAAGIFFVGFVLAGIASVGTALQRRRH